MNKIDTSNLGNVVIFHPKGEKATLEVQSKRGNCLAYTGSNG